MTNPRNDAPRRQPRHLMDPANMQAYRTTQRSLTRVQQWVMSTLATTTVLHMSLGLVVAAFHVAGGRTEARVGLLVVAGLFGMVAVGVGMMIHRRSPLSAWLLLGWIPSVIGAWLLFG